VAPRRRVRAATCGGTAPRAHVDSDSDAILGGLQHLAHADHLLLPVLLWLRLRQLFLLLQAAAR